MNHAGALLWLAAIAAAGCSVAERRDRGGDADAVDPPVFQPMLVVGLPDLHAADGAGRMVESMTARNTPVADVLLSLFKDSDINLLVDEAVQQERCTFDIKHATVEEAFESLLRSLDLGFEWDGSFLRVRRNVRCTLYVDLLDQAATAGEGGKAAATTTGGFWSEIEPMLTQIVGDGKAIVNQAASAIHVEASPAAVARVREVVDTTLRRRNTQVSIEARILEVRLDDQHNLGINWSLLPGLFHSTRTGLGPGGAIVSQTASSGGTSLGFGLLDDNQYSVFVDALARQGQVRVLSSPRVSTMNHEPANIRVADQIPVISREVITDQGVARSEFSVSFVEAGVVVQVTPMIGEDGMITVRVNPEVTEQTGTVVTPDGLVTQPILSRRSADTIVRVADGQAVVIGGLRKTRKDETLQGVPFLMDLPALGQLFSSTVQTRQEIELMIVVVPRLLDGAWLAEDVRRGADRLVTLRRPFRWNSIGLDSYRPEDWRGGALSGEPGAAGAPEARLKGPPPAADDPGKGNSVTRAGLAMRLCDRAQTALDRGQQRQALAWLEEALELDPRRVDALVVRGVLESRLGLAARARATLDRALQVAPDDPLVLTARGALELTDGSPPAALRWFERVDHRQRSAETATNLGAALLMAGDAAGARELLHGLADENAPPELLANLASCDLAAGDLAAAREHLQQARRAGADVRNPRIQALTRLIDEAADGR